MIIVKDLYIISFSVDGEDYQEVLNMNNVQNVSQEKKNEGN